MRLEVSPESLEKTICSADYPCLNGEPKCKVNRKVINDISYTLNVEKASCLYFIPLKGCEGFCCCPVRFELYDKYGI
jgi:hypothetical protein